ncbi:MAG: thiolase family protein [Chloroflexi bacterium]|nr:thiolase family protein [Chloroflexota bacterium]
MASANDNDVVIVEAVRTAVGRRGGSLSGTNAVVLLSQVLQELMKRAGVDASEVEDVVAGCVDQVGEQSLNVARNAMLTAGFPFEVPATSVDRQCGSAQQAIHFAANLIQANVCDVTVGCGVENMSRVPMGANVSKDVGFPFPPELMDRYALTSQGVSAEMIAEKWGISRADTDQFGFESQMKAAKARDAGRFKKEILPIDVTLEGVDTTFEVDEGIRDTTTVEKLGTLNPPFKENGVHTAGNSSQISDGAAALLLMSGKKAKELGVTPRARIIAQAVVGSDPILMLTGPITATPKVLDKAGLKLEDMDLVEINEAFAAVVLAWQKELNPDMSKVNVNGGAIALGHPLGCTGAKLMTTLLHELERTDGRYGLQTMCCGGGLGTATIIERLS